MTADDGRRDALLAEAREATARRDAVLALRTWQSIAALDTVESTEKDLEVEIGIGNALRQLRRWEEAEACFFKLRAVYPDDLGVAVGWAWVLHERGALSEAAERWADIRRRWPGEEAGYYGEGAALRSLGRYVEANTVYEDAFAEGLHRLHIVYDYALLANASGDHDEARRRWAALRKRAPDWPPAYTGSASALAAAGDFNAATDLYKTAIEQFPANKELLLGYARMVRRHGALATALKAWESVIEADHGPEGYLGASEVLAELGRIEDARTVLAPAVRLFADNLAILEHHASLAYRARVWDAALAGWKNIRERFGDRPRGWIEGVRTLCAASFMDDADALATEGIERFPDSLDMHAEWALVPLRHQNYATATNRAAMVVERFPANRSARNAWANSLAFEKKEEEAERALDEAEQQLGVGRDFHFARARLADIAKNLDVAEARWAAVLEQYPDDISAHVGLIRALWQGGKLANARDCADRALVRFPSSIDIEIQRAIIASRLREWRRALPLWAQLKSRAPHHPDIPIQIRDALWQARLDQAVYVSEADRFEIPDGLLESASQANEPAEELKNLFMKFESLGNSCEFGIVQRRFGAEPIGLMRWSSIEPKALIDALHSRFEAMSDPAETIVWNDGGEYVTKNRRYGVFSHTFTPANSESLDKFQRSQMIRTRFLVQKLCDDIELGEKTLVYVHPTLTIDLARQIYRSICDYGGSSSILCVCLADDRHPVGHWERLDHGLFVGFSDRFSTVDINIENWKHLCKAIDGARERIASDAAMMPIAVSK